MAKNESLMASSAQMSYRKALGYGMGEGAGNFGVESFERGMVKNGPKPHPAPAASAPMIDAKRGVGMPVARKGADYPAQAAPDHGKPGIRTPKGMV